MKPGELRIRKELVSCAHRIQDRGLSHGSTGNVSVRWADMILVTPTGTRLGEVTVDALSVIDLDGRHVDGPRPSKEAALHAAILRARPESNAVVHTHSTHAAAVSCIAESGSISAIPPLTAYFLMRVGELPLVPFFAPGDVGLAHEAERLAGVHRAMLLRNHGPIAAAEDVGTALDVIDEIEETAKVFLLLGAHQYEVVPFGSRGALRSAETTSQRGSRP
ncbi:MULTISPECIES: class II aldolase/adducin family protein [unclassified Microbacterium]|uniref:class II aldolase/adducin family protein n=1 Tax=unclassified Microbacterium TaxID=2609290 RepID=UPI00364BFF62